MDPLWCAVWLAAGALVAAPAGYGLARLLDRTRLAAGRLRGEQIIEQARKEAEHHFKEAQLRARDELFQKREEFNREQERGRAETREQERRLEKREDAVEQKSQLLMKKERSIELGQKKLADRRDQLAARALELDAAVEQASRRLHDLAGLSAEQAQKVVLERVERELTDEVAERIRRAEERVRATCEERARGVLATAIHRYAADHTADTTVSTVDIPSDDMKGRIIGREGRNIRTFEKATGVDVIVDDTPGVVIVSAFDNVRRETARLALAKLIQDGRIHPTRIEEVVTETQGEMEKHILDVGRRASLDAGVGVLHDKLFQLLGRLKFRTSYSQNVLQHSLEVAHLCGLMADELNLNGTLARRCGLLHDIGKAADHEMEGGHPKVGAELARRYGETNKDVLHAIEGHHDDVTVDHVYTVLVAAADAISASRPGARRETLEKYVKRLEQLETLAGGFPGVEQVYAIQAGREVRVIANAQALSDADSLRLSRDIAKAIEESMDYPGEIKVTVVRETRSVAVAR